MDRKPKQTNSKRKPNSVGFTSKDLRRCRFCDYHEHKDAVIVKKVDGVNYFICWLCQMDTKEEILHRFIDVNRRAPIMKCEFERLANSTGLDVQQIKEFYAEKIDALYPDENKENDKENDQNENLLYDSDDGKLFSN